MQSKRISIAVIKVAVLSLCLLSCNSTANELSNGSEKNSSSTKQNNPDSIVLEDKQEFIKKVVVGAENTSEYIAQLKGKRVAVVGNQTSLINGVHLVDSLLSSGISVVRVFSPEHGFRGNHDAGAKVKHSIDSLTGLPVFSLHGSSKKPSASSLNDVDVVVFDLQDVGVRFYTYLSTLHYVMEACAEQNKALLVLDRPNPNAHYVAGPVLQKQHQSFLGLHPVPVVYGMSIGEYAQMINGEGWLKDSIKCKLTVVPLANWDHQTIYKLPIKPSPNLPNQLSVYLYPHLCWFEGTIYSVGRGTDKPFQQYGHPYYKDTTYSFTPKRTEGAALYPKLKDKLSYGVDLSTMEIDSVRSLNEINFEWFIDAYNKNNSKKPFINRNAHLKILFGRADLREQVKAGKNSKEINLSWKNELDSFKLLRAKYLLYP